MTFSRSRARQMPRNRVLGRLKAGEMNKTELGRELMQMVRHQSPELAEEVKIRALILIETKNKSERKAA